MLTIQEYIALLDARDLMIREQKKRILELEEALEKRDIELATLRRSMYGSSSEKMKKPEIPEQPTLFPDDEQTIDAIDNTVPKIPSSDIVDAIEQESEQRRIREKSKKRAKQQTQRRIIKVPANLEKDITTLYPEGYDPETMEIIGKDKTVTLEEQKRKYYLKEIVRVVCVHKGENKSASRQILQHPLIPRIFEGGYLGDSVITGILINKFCHHLPEYRQSKMFKEQGLNIPTSTINRAVHQTIEKLYPLYYAQMKAVLTSPYVHMDETTIRVNDRKGGSRKAYLWDMADGSPQAGNKGLFFYYREGSRSKDVMRLMLDGYEGAVQVDGYKVYEALDLTPQITLLHCMTHARRKFENIKDLFPQDVPHILKYFALLYQIEANLKERNASPEEVKAEREEKALPILNYIEQWLTHKSKECIPKSALGGAINYALTRWDKLCAYTQNGIYQIDNNQVERSIRPIALGRKNWLFINNDESGEDFAVITTLIQSCEYLGVNPKTWLMDVFSKIAGQKDYDIDSLLPYKYV